MDEDDRQIREGTSVMARPAQNDSPYVHAPAVYGEDLFSAAALVNPFPHYKAIRDLGPVVRLACPDVLVLSRFIDVRDALRAPDILISGQGIGFNDIVNTPRPHPPTITSDGARHRRLRGNLNRFLMPAALKTWRAMFRELIGERIARLRQDGEWFDAMEAIAKHLPLEAVVKLVGLPPEASNNMLRWAGATFNTFGIAGPSESQRKDFETGIAVRDEIQAFLRGVDAADLKPGSWAATLFAAVDEGRMDLDEARSALSALVLPSLDTTILAKGNLLHNLACSPDQWRTLQGNPAMVTGAVMEGMRHRPVVRWFSRMATADYDSGDVHIPGGTRVMILYGSANLDERHYPDPERFDIGRAPMDQLGWGTGPHMCAGMHLARLEMEVLLEALIEEVNEIEIGEPTLGQNQGLYGFTTLPMRLH